jgi:hypothetical protein
MTKVNSRVRRRETINHPQHYGGDTTYEVIKVIEAWGLDASFCLGNTVKYIARAGKKGNNKLEDLQKALWYLQREVDKLDRRKKEVQK